VLRIVLGWCFVVFGSCVCSVVSVFVGAVWAVSVFRLFFVCCDRGFRRACGCSLRGVGFLGGCLVSAPGVCLFCVGRRGRGRGAGGYGVMFLVWVVFCWWLGLVRFCCV